MISTATDEAKVQKLFPNEDLHGLYEKRICFSYDLLEYILNTNKKMRDAFLDRCKKKLVEKSFKSLDFYDVYKISCAVSVGRYYLNFDSSEGIGIVDPEKINVDEKIEFNVESAANFTFQIDENEKLNEKISTLEKRLNNLEIRMDKFEKKTQRKKKLKKKK